MKINFFVILLVLSFVLFSCSEKKDVVKQDSGTNMSRTTEQVTKDTSTFKTDTTKNMTQDTSKSVAGEEGNRVVLETSLGTMVIELLEKDAPKHTANFKKHVTNKFYEGTTFHRVIEGFMIQGGDPNSKDNDRSNDGQGGPGYTIPAEIKAGHEKGSVAGARLGDAQNPKRESSGSQFYIVTGNASHLNGQYTVFGKVVKGLDIALKIEKVKKDNADNPIEKVVIKKVYFEKNS